jgi:glycosyltransferase involved in cell wall biosynthesis
MTTSKTIIFLDRNSIITSNQQTLNRHAMYADDFREYIKCEIKFIVLQNQQDQLSDVILNEESLIIHRIKPNRWNLLGRLIEYRNFLHSLKDSESVFICGDPWKPVIQLMVLRVIGKQRYPFQVQIHFDIFDSKWRYSSLKNLAKYVLALPGLYWADNLRFVSGHQTESLSSRALLKSKKIFVTPVPLNLEYTKIHPTNSPRPRVIGFLGRLSEDRGIKYLECLATSIKGTDIRMIVAGEGPAEEILKRKLTNILESDQIDFPGFLEGSNLAKFWNSIGALFSPAQTESYGRTIRESLCYGIPVIAMDSLGALVLKQGVLSEFVHIFNKNSITKISKSDIEICFAQNIGSIAILEEIATADANKDKLYASWRDLYVN